jgi:hypothetical protein
MESLEQILSPAEKHYEAIKRAVKKYQTNNRDKCRASCKTWMQNLKADPEKYKEYLESKKVYMKQRRMKQKDTEIEAIPI